MEYWSGFSLTSSLIRRPNSFQSPLTSEPNCFISGSEILARNEGCAFQSGGVQCSSSEPGSLKCFCSKKIFLKLYLLYSEIFDWLLSDGGVFKHRLQVQGLQLYLPAGSKVNSENYANCSLRIFLLINLRPNATYWFMCVPANEAERRQRRLCPLKGRILN